MERAATPRLSRPSTGTGREIDDPVYLKKPPPPVVVVVEVVVTVLSTVVASELLSPAK